MTSNDDNPASFPVVDSLDNWKYHINGSNFSWTPERTSFAPVNFDDIRQYNPSFDDEDFDEGTSSISAVISNASETSPYFQHFSDGSSLTGDYGGGNRDMYLCGDPQRDVRMEWESAPGMLHQPDTQLESLHPPDRLAGSPSNTFEDIWLGEPLIPTAESSRMSLEPKGHENISVDNYVLDDLLMPTIGEGGSSLYQEYVQLGQDKFREAESGNNLPVAESLAAVPPVTVSPCTRPSSPLPERYFTFPSCPPSPSSPRKRHYSESAGTRSRPVSHCNSLTVDAPILCFSPFKMSPKDAPCPPRMIRSPSLRAKKHSERGKRRCQYCPDPSVWKRDQKVRLDELPPELLIEIFTFACSSLPAQQAWTCEHKRVDYTRSDLPRSSTLSGAFPDNREATEREKQSENMLVGFYQRRFNLPRHLRLLQARTIRALQLTCKMFCHIFTQYPNVDNILWKEATTACWGHLPKTLAEVQGWNKTSQTCWRNVFGVFMRSDNGMFKKRGRGGVGGVESFGGKSGFKQAVLWKEEKILRAEAKKLQEEKTATAEESTLEGKGKQMQVRHAIADATPNTINRRKLLLVCPQPGPDVFTVKALPGEGGGYDIGLCLQNKEMVFVRLDEYGNFSNRKRTLPHNLKRSKKGQFPPDCFEVIGDRYRIVKVERVKIFNDGTPGVSSLHGYHGPERMEAVMTWNLDCVPEFGNDKRAFVARCEHQNEYLVFNMFASREGFIEGLDRPTEDPRVFCVMAEGTIPSFKTHWKGKMRASGQGAEPSGSSTGPRTVSKWQRSFVHPREQDYPISQGLHYIICNLKLNSQFAVVLIRWNIHSKVSYHEYVDRSFQVLDLNTGSTVKVLQFPNFHWDFRHHDMTVEYNVMRYYKMRCMFNAPHAGDRATRIHKDEFTLDDNGRLISGSHDYCNWMWDLNADIDEQKERERVFTPLHNDAGNGDPFEVLDDFYWEGDNQENGEQTGAWDTHNERAGWWVKTPNQVLCFWHSITTSKDGRWFSAVRAGRMFVWDLEDTTKVQGFSCALGTYTGQVAENVTNAGKAITPIERPPTVDMRYLGKPLNPRVEGKLKSWHVWNGIIPEQGLWLMYDDGKVVYLDRDDILDACGLRQEGKQWAFNRSDFGNLDTESEDTGDSINHEDDYEDGDGSQSESDAEKDLATTNKEVPDAARRKRRRTLTMKSSASRSSSFITDQEGLVIDMSEQFMFENELPEAETWEKMDDEGWLKRVKEEIRNGRRDPMEGSSGAQ